MQFSVTFRKIETTDALKQYAQEKVHKIKKYFPEPITAKVVLSVERHTQRADINIVLHNGLVLKGQESSGDMYGSIDKAVDKIERQLRKYKDKIRRHKSQPGPQIPVRHNILKIAERVEPMDMEMAADAEPEPDELFFPTVVRTSEFTAKPMTVEEAIMQLDLRHGSFLVFTNADSRAINVIYKREDGNYGLIETPSQAI